MKVGLTLGKFAPLHDGHRLLIDTALDETDHVVVIVYDVPETTPVPLPVRAGWLRTLYPSIEVLEAWDGPVEVGDSPAIRKMHEDFLVRLLAGRRITHFYSSEFYGEHVSQALGALDRRVDAARIRVPISATEIRADPYAHRRFIPPVVYRDLVTKVVLLGAPSTGKTTLAERLAKRFGTTWMPEYGREYWAAHQVDRRLSLQQLVEIAEGHVAREDALTLEANRLLFVDTDATTTRLFSLHYHGTALPRLRQLAAQAHSRYDLVFLCGDDIPYEAAWDRSGAMQRRRFQERIRADLIGRQVPFVELLGDVEQRLEAVAGRLVDFARFDVPGSGPGASPRPR